MRVLIIAFSDSIHTARWISQISEQGWDIHLFPSEDKGKVHSELKNVTVYHSFSLIRNERHPSVRVRGIPICSETLAYHGRSLLRKISRNYRTHQLSWLIKHLRPDIIHTLEIQAAGYLTLDVKNNYSGIFPTWIVSNWGSDIYLFGRLKDHKDRIKAVLKSCDYYTCECERDVKLAINLGFQGEMLPVLPSAGGFDLEHAAQFRQPGPTSERKFILLKGYQGWAGRALVGLRAITLCANELRGYRVGIYLASPEVKISAELVSQSTGIPIDLFDYATHDEMLKRYGCARVYLGLSISDAISTSLLEAMVMGAFPIQSCTSCADEWIVDGESGIIVPPEDPEPIAEALRRAITDDCLVNQAAEINAQVARERLAMEVIQPKIIAMYERVVAGKPQQ